MNNILDTLNYLFAWHWYLTRSILQFISDLFQHLHLLAFSLHPKFTTYIIEFEDFNYFVNFFWEDIRIWRVLWIISICILWFFVNILLYYIWVWIRKICQLKNSQNNFLINYFIIYFRFLPFVWFLGNIIAWLKYDIKFFEVFYKNLIWNFLYFILISQFVSDIWKISLIGHINFFDFPWSPEWNTIWRLLSIFIIITIYYWVKFFKKKK
jgi:hypothetical protein